MEVKTSKHQSLQHILVALFVLLKQDFLPRLGETVYRGCFGEVGWVCPSRREEALYDQLLQRSVGSSGENAKPQVGPVTFITVWRNVMPSKVLDKWPAWHLQSCPCQQSQKTLRKLQPRKKKEEMMMGRKDKIPPNIYKTPTHSLIICSRSFKVGIDREREVSGWEWFSSQVIVHVSVPRLRPHLVGWEACAVSSFGWGSLSGGAIWWPLSGIGSGNIH